MRFRRRGFHYLGNLGSKLADLQGYATLAQELIQNADDVGDAEWLRFDIRSDGLVVDNGGSFRSCGHLELDDCPWLADPNRARRCDFHRFAWIGSGDKRLEDNTTGAFGIGFLTVYQITDAPELISVGEHWILDELAQEAERIRVCDGCDRCRAAALPGTRFVLPWARDPESPLRRELHAQAFGEGEEVALGNALRGLLPDSMLFLRSLERIGLAVDGVTVLDLHRLCDGSEVLVQSDGVLRSWRRFSFSFADEAQVLRAKYPGKIEDSRSTEVIVAFTDGDNDGRLFAWLPTQEPTGLSCHVHADFFPTNDRKGLLWELGYRSEWNAAALKGAAQAIRNHLTDVRDHIGHVRFWKLCQDAKTLAEGQRQAFRCFWKELLPIIRTTACVFTHGGQWVLPSVATVVDPAQRDCQPAIDALGIAAVHEDLDFARNILTERASGAGVGILRLSSVIERVSALRLVAGTALEACPPLLKEPGLRQQFWTLLDRMLASPQAGAKEDGERVRGLPILASTEGSARAPAELGRANADTQALFAELGLSVPLLYLTEGLPQLCALVPEIAVGQVLTCLEGNPRPIDGKTRNLGPSGPLRLLEWFARRQDEFEGQPLLKARLSALSLFPAGTGYRPLDQLSLPGAFDDPLGVAELVDVSRARNLVPFLKSLGAKELSLPEYVKRQVPQALKNDSLSVSLKRSLVALLADRLGELQNDPQCHTSLADLCIVEDEHGEFVTPSRAYFGTGPVRMLLPQQPHIVALPVGREQSVQAFYSWLGVANEPRFSDLLAMLVDATGVPPTESTRRRVCAVFKHLGARVAGQDGLVGELSDLRSRHWLPAQGDEARWWSPKELAASFRQDLFFSQMAFLDVERDVQQQCAHLIDLLGIQGSPTVQQVARHLRHCANAGIPVSEDVYRRLSEEKWSQDPALEMLVGTKCIYISGHGYVLPRHIFWSDPGFGSYRHTLSDSLRVCARLLDRVGVRKSAEPSDAIDVLIDVSSDTNLRGKVLEGNPLSVVNRCWTVLADAHRSGQLADHALAVLSDKAVVVDASGMLNRPDVLFFEDRPNLGEYFRDSLGSIVIPLPDQLASVMEVAGVRRLSRHVAVELLECEDRSDYFFVQGRCEERLEQLRRAAAPSAPISMDGAQWSRLREISHESAAKLIVRFRCDALGRVWYSSPQTRRAIFLPDEDTLLINFHEGPVSWPEIARELALIIFPDFEPGRVSGAFAQVLAASSADEADDVLDALGMPRIVAVPPPRIPPEPPVGGLGGSADSRTVGPPPGPSVRPTKGRTRPRSRYVTYVVPDVGTPSPAADETADGESRHTAEAGVRRVRWFEEAAGRHVTVMPPNNPGYDLECRLAEGGEVERFIEVKSLSGDWGNDGVGLTVTEFESAQKKGDQYWLYVVERASSEKYTIHRIQNPGRKANWFFFDRGWSQVAEPTSS